MEFNYNQFDLGATKPFTILHISDIHLTLWDDRERDAVINLAIKRSKRYTHSEDVMEQAELFSKRCGGLIVNTGDMNDFMTHKNAERIKMFSEQNDCFFVTGNHDFRPYGGMEYDVPANRECYFDKVQNLHNNPIRYHSRVINGINLVGLDNAYYRFEQWQFDVLKKEVAKGFPIILCLHVPIYDEGLYGQVVQGKRKHASLCDVPAHKMTEYPIERLIQQKSDIITHKMCEYIKKEPTIRLLLTGHLHKDYACTLGGRLPQICTSIDEIREIKIL